MDSALGVSGMDQADKDVVETEMMFARKSDDTRMCSPPVVEATVRQWKVGKVKISDQLGESTPNVAHLLNGADHGKDLKLKVVNGNTAWSTSMGTSSHQVGGTMECPSQAAATG